MSGRKPKKSKSAIGKSDKLYAEHELSAPKFRKNYPKWRAFSLSLVYLVFAIHIIHWKITGSTLAPLELNEVMYTLELGIITAGFLFMCMLVLGTLIFGRFFCSWACHIIVLQDFCAWLLKKIGIRAKPIRSRLLLFVPPLTAMYMFLWPQVVRAWESKSFPEFHFTTDADGWASFVTNDFWRNLPGPWVIALTFIVCGFAIVYLLGSRTFCTYVCPYGAVFSLVDRFSPGRILVNDNCEQCGRCTAACSSGIRVHKEILQHGMIVNPACMKDLDCVSVCPNDALRYGMAKPALFKSYKSGGRFGLPWDFSIAEELLASTIFIFVLLSFRGLYNRIPFLLSLALGAIIGYLCILSLRLITRPHVKLSTFTLKDKGQIRFGGRLFTSSMVVVIAFVLHSSFIRYHEYTGLRQAIALNNHKNQDKQQLASSAIQHLSTAAKWGLFGNVQVERSRVLAAAHLGQLHKVNQYTKPYLARFPYDHQIRYTYAHALMNHDQTTQAEEELRWIITQSDMENPKAKRLATMSANELAKMLGRRGDYAGTIDLLRTVVTLDEKNASAHADLGSALAEMGQLDEAIQHLQLAVSLDPGASQAAYNLGTLLAHTGKFDLAIPYYQRALEKMSDDADLYNNLGSALLRTGNATEAMQILQRAIELNPDHADAHFNLAVLLASEDRMDQAQQHMQIAARLDPRYEQFLQNE